MTSGNHSDVVQRDESQDDYDLLTYGEVAARLSEEMAAETRRIAELQATGIQPEIQHALEERLAVLAEGKRRYEQQAQTAEVFMRRFGLAPRRDDPTVP
jgi:hypothetical protein